MHRIPHRYTHVPETIKDRHDLVVGSSTEDDTDSTNSGSASRFLRFPGCSASFGFVTVTQTRVTVAGRRRVGALDRARGLPDESDQSVPDGAPFFYFRFVYYGCALCLCVLLFFVCSFPYLQVNLSGTGRSTGRGERCSQGRGGEEESRDVISRNFRFSPCPVIKYDPRVTFVRIGVVRARASRQSWTGRASSLLRPRFTPVVYFPGVDSH